MFKMMCVHVCTYQVRAIARGCSQPWVQPPLPSPVLEPCLGPAGVLKRSQPLLSRLCSPLSPEIPAWLRPGGSLSRDTLDLRCAFYLSSMQRRKQTENWKLESVGGGGWTIKESFRPNLQCLNYMHVYNCKKMYIKCTCMEGPVRYKSINDLYFIILQIFKIDKWLYTNLGHRNIYHNKIVCVRCCNLCVDSSCQNSLSYQLRYQPPPPSRIRKCHFFTFSIFILVKSLNQ